MRYGKPAMLIGGLLILASSLAYEWATFSQMAEAYRVVGITMIAGLLGLLLWLAGCVMICKTGSGPNLFGGGALTLLFLFVGGAMLEHFDPALTNVHVGMPGLLAPMAACFLGGLIFILVGIFRLVAN